ncbi:hypothetical protein GGR58DRAFT_505631 [Xylaria digitata]|nr:hypothetical protein GGR58DRAFT_505631 [Xylaria digitata]
MQLDNWARLKPPLPSPNVPTKRLKEDTTTDQAASTDVSAKATAGKAVEKTGETAKPAKSAKTSDGETLKEIYGNAHVNDIFLVHVDASKSTLGGSIIYATGIVDGRSSERLESHSFPICL